MNNKKSSKEKVLKEREWYRKKIVEMVSGIVNETILKKIYTVVKTYIDILNE